MDIDSVAAAAGPQSSSTEDREEEVGATFVSLHTKSAAQLVHDASSTAPARASQTHSGSPRIGRPADSAGRYHGVEITTASTTPTRNNRDWDGSRSGLAMSQNSRSGPCRTFSRPRECRRSCTRPHRPVAREHYESDASVTSERTLPRPADRLVVRRDPSPGAPLRSISTDLGAPYRTAATLQTATRGCYRVSPCPRKSTSEPVLVGRRVGPFRPFRGSLSSPVW